MKKYICLRDDDTSFFTSPKEIQDAYGEFWGKLPVTLGVVPFINGTNAKVIEFEPSPERVRLAREWEINASHEELARYFEIHPVGDNEELVSELRKQISNGMVEIAQHGVNHLFNERGAEMFGDQVGFYTIRAGKEYLQKVFGCPVETFIAPSNTVDRVCSESIMKLNMNLFCGAIRYLNKKDKLLSLITHPDSLLEKLKRGKNDKWIPLRNRNGVRIFGCVTYDIFKNEDDIYQQVLDNLEHSGFSALCTHYFLAKDENYKAHYQSLLRRLSQLNDVEFVTATKYYELAEKKYYE